MAHPGGKGGAGAREGQLVMKPGAAATLGEAATAPGLLSGCSPGRPREPARQPEAFAGITCAPPLRFTDTLDTCRPEPHIPWFPRALTGQIERRTAWNQWKVSVIMEVPHLGHGRTNPKTPGRPTRPSAWSSSGPPTCRGRHDHGRSPSQKRMGSSVIMEVGRGGNQHAMIVEYRLRARLGRVSVPGGRCR
jgi:hypothetical protein